MVPATSVVSRVAGVLATLTLALFGHLSAQSGGVVQGRVTDGETGQAVNGASIALGAGPVLTITDSDGHYRLAVPSGSRLVRVTRIGFADAARAVDVIPNDTVTIDILLVPAAAQLDEIAVRASGQEIREVRTSPYSVTVIDAQQLAGRGVTLDEALQRVSGMQVRRSGGLGSESVFNVRGLEGPRVQIYVNGNALNIPGHAFTLDNIPLQVIDRVEVYKGVVPAHFGGDGLGAAINVVTKHPEGGYADVGTTIGSFGLRQLSATGQRSISERHGLDVRGTLIHDAAENDYVMQSPFVDDLIIRRDHDAFRRTIAVGRLTLRHTWFDQLEFLGAFFGSHQEVQGIQTNIQHAESGTSLWVAEVEADRVGAAGGRFDVRTAFILARSTTMLRDTSSIRYQFDGPPFPSPFGRGELGILPSDSRTVATTLRHRTAATYRFAPAHTVNFTYVLDHTKVVPNDSLANRYAGRNVSDFPGDLSSAVIGLSHEWRPMGDRFIAVTGTRGYAFVANGTPSNLGNAVVERAPKVTNRTASLGVSEGLRFFVTPTMLVKASIEAARRLPTPTELFGDGLLVVASPQLRPERSLNLSAGLQYDRVFSGERRLQAEVNAFSMELRDLITLTLGGGGRSAYGNLGRARIRGVDFEVKGDPSRWLYASLNATYQNARDVLPTILGSAVPNPTYGLRLPNLPWLFATATMELHAENLLGAQQRAKLFYEGSFTEEYFYAFELSRLQERRIPRALTHTVGVEQQWLGLGVTASIEVQNLTDARVLSRFNMPLPGRQLRAKLRYTWVGE